MPEIDGWLYEGLAPGKYRSYQCASFVGGVYKAAGLFGDLIINPNEWTNRDIYIMDIFEK